MAQTATVPKRPPPTKAQEQEQAKAKAKPVEPAKPVKAPAFKITSIPEAERYIKLLVYGEYGVGKTRLCGTAVAVPEMNDILLIDAESGTLTLVDDALPFDKISVVQVKTYRQVSKVHQFLKLHCQLRDQDTKESEAKLAEIESQLTDKDVTKPKHFRTVIVDSLSEVEAYCMNQLLGITDTTSLDEEGVPPEFKEYKINNGMMRRMVRDFRNLPMNLLVTCAQTFTEDEMKRKQFMPALTGQLRGQVQGFMDVVGYLRAGNPNDAGDIPRALFVQPSGRWQAKCRFSAFKGIRFDDPHIKSILEAVGLRKSVTKAKAKGG